MTTFFICRHGETENNKNQRLSGWIDTPLTDTGVQNALSSAAKLAHVQLNAIIASDLGRAFITAYLISRHLGYSADITADKRFREVNYGDFSNQPITAYPKLTATENADYVPPNGESLIQMQQRVLAGLANISQTTPTKTTLLVAHDGTINAIRASFTRQNIGVVDAQNNNSHDFVASFAYDNGQITTFNEVTN